MSKILKESLIRKNRHMYTSALKAIERVMGDRFQEGEDFKKIRSMILTVGNEISRSIDTEIDQYAIVVKDGAAPRVTSASEFIKSLLPRVKFTSRQNTDGTRVPSMVIETKDDGLDLSLLREVLGCGMVVRKGSAKVFEVCGARDCSQIIPIFEQFMQKVPNPLSYRQWVNDVYEGYRNG